MSATHDNNRPTTLRDQIGLAVIAAHKTFDDSGRWTWADYGGHIADAVMEILPASYRFEPGQGLCDDPPAESVAS